jgi:hypothetical protein
MQDVVHKLNGFPIRVNQYFRELETKAIRVYPDNNHLVEILTEYINMPDMIKESKKFETRQNTEKHYNWDNIAKKWESYLDNVELTGLQGRWDVPLQPVQEIREDELPPETTAYDFVTQLAGMHMSNNEQFLSSNVITDCIHDLDYGFKIIGMQNKGITKKDVVQQLNNFIKNHNFAVHAQRNEDKLTPEDFINYANMKGQS